MAYSSNCEQENRDYQIFVYDLEQNNSKQITQNSREIKKEMIWSDDNSEIVFTKSNEIEEISADWLIYKTDLNGNEKFIASNSQNPFFGENKNEILASREGDFHFYNIEKDTGIRPLYSESKLLINNQFDVSDNKDKLVFLTDISGEKRIEKYGIEDWDKFKISRLAKMEVLSNEHAEWLRIQPVIGKYVIGKNTEFNSSENLKAYYLEENEQYQIADFNDKYDLIQINDWK
jgi:Tol biopolymer transport system component